MKLLERLLILAIMSQIVPLVTLLELDGKKNRVTFVNGATMGKRICALKIKELVRLVLKVVSQINGAVTVNFVLRFRMGYL